MAYSRGRVLGETRSCWENSSKGPPRGQTLLDQGYLQLDDLEWDNIEESDDHIVPEPDQESRESAWSHGCGRRKKYRKQARSGKSSGLSSQRSLGSNTTLNSSQEGNSRADFDAVSTPETMLESCRPISPAMWPDLMNGADHAVTKLVTPHQTAFSPPAMLSGRESVTEKDDMQVECLILGSGGMGSGCLGVYMADPLYSEDDTSIVTTSCHFTLGDVNPEESGLPLFGSDGDDRKVDYSWDQCFGNLEDVDNLLSSGPESAFGPVTSSPDGMQWHDSASPPAVQQDNHLPRARSSPGTNCGTAVKGKADVFDMTMEFVPIENPLPVPTTEKTQNLTFKDSEFLPTSSYGSRLQNLHIQEGQQCVRQLGTLFNAGDCLDDEKMSQVIAGSVPLPETNGNSTPEMEVPEDESGPSSVSLSESEKVKMAQAHRARRHAVNRRRCEERTKRQHNQRKILHGLPFGSPQGPQMLQPMPVHTATQPGQLHPTPSPTLHGYPVTPSPLSPLQPMMRPASPYMQYGPPQHLIPPVAATSVPTQMQGQGMYVGYQQLCSFQQPFSHHQQHQLRPPGEVSIRPAPISPTMTPQEKLEKLRFLQQMQARFAVEQQQQQLAAQGVAPLDPGPLHKGQTPLPQSFALSQPDVAANISEVKMTASESDFEPSLSVGQTSVEATSDDEDGSLEAVVLEQLQSTMKVLEVGTKLCIRDALYRLARSAMRRQASGGRTSGGDAAISSETSQDADATSNGLETSINSDPSSSSRVSRMNMNLVETQTNPIDRSIAQLLFHKRQPQPVNVHSAPNNDDTCLVHPQSSLAGPTSIPGWHQGSLPQASWAAVPQILRVGGAVQGIVSGVEMGSVPQLRPCMSSKTSPSIAIPLLTQDGAGLVTNDTVTNEHHTGGLSRRVADSPLSGQLQGSVVGTDMFSEELPSPLGTHASNRASNELRALPTQGVTNSGQKDHCEISKGLPSKRLQHATGLTELSKLLKEGLDVRSNALDNEESGIAQSGPPLSMSSCSDELQAGVHLKDINNLGDGKTLKCHTE